MAKNDKKPANEQYYTVAEVCEMLSFTRPTIMKYIQTGELRADIFFGSYRIPASALEEAKNITPKQ
jgi:excisionase family DNA binding protein